MFSAMMIPTRGELELVQVVDYQHKQRLIGGLFDVIVVTRTIDDRPVTFDVWVDDEGLLKQLDLNPRASILAGRTIVGPALVTGQATSEGDCTNVQEPVIAFCNAVDMAVVKAQLPPEQEARAVATLSQENPG